MARKLTDAGRIRVLQKLLKYAKSPDLILKNKVRYPKEADALEWAIGILEGERKSQAANREFYEHGYAPRPAAGAT